MASDFGFDHLDCVEKEGAVRDVVERAYLAFRCRPSAENGDGLLGAVATWKLLVQPPAHGSEVIHEQRHAHATGAELLL